MLDLVSSIRLPPDSVVGWYNAPWNARRCWLLSLVASARHRSVPVLAVVFYTLPTRHLANRHRWPGCCVRRWAQPCTWSADSSATVEEESADQVHGWARPTDPWLDAECRAAKRLTRRLERAYAAACRRRSAADATAARVAWYDQRKAYRQLRQQKCRDFWAEKIETEWSHPAKLWRSVDQLLGRGRVPMTSSIDVEIINQFFADEVANVRLSTDNTPIVKKAWFDSTEACSYRRISNLPVLSKLLEPLVARQSINCLTASNLLPPLQSGFSPGHFTESAVLHVLSDVLLAVDCCDFVAVAMLDLSAVFNRVDYNILLQRLQTSYGIKGLAMQWFRSYLVGRTQRPPWCHYIVGRSSRMLRSSGICDWSDFVRPLHGWLNCAYQELWVVNLSPHLYADDSLIYGSCTLVVNVYIVVHINCVHGISTQNCVAAHGASTSKRGCRRCLRLNSTFCKVIFFVKICAKSHCDRGRYTWITAAAFLDLHDDDTDEGLEGVPDEGNNIQFVVACALSDWVLLNYWMHVNVQGCCEFNRMLLYNTSAVAVLQGQCYYPSIRAYWRYFPSARRDGLIITLNEQ